MAEATARAALVRSALEAAMTGDETVLDGLYAEDVQGWGPTMTVTSRDALAAELRGRQGAFSDVDVLLDPVDVIGDKVIAEWRVAGTHSGVLELGDDFLLNPTGRRVELRGVVVAEFDGDRIARFRQYWDEADLLEGLGLLPEE